MWDGMVLIPDHFFSITLRFMRFSINSLIVLRYVMPAKLGGLYIQAFDMKLSNDKFATLIYSMYLLIKLNTKYRRVIIIVRQETQNQSRYKKIVVR